MTEPRTSITPTGAAGTVPSTSPDHPDWDAIKDGEGHVWVHFYAGVWEQLLSKEMAARFVASAPTCCGRPMYRCEAEHTDGKGYFHCRSCVRNVEATEDVAS